MDNLDSEKLRSVTKKVIGKLVNKLEGEKNLDCFNELITTHEKHIALSVEEKKIIACLMPMAYEANNNMIQVSDL